MNQVRIGMIGGTGQFGSHRRRVIEQNPRARIVALCGRDAAKLKEAAAPSGARVYTAWPELIADPQVDAVAVAIPNALHFEVAHAALAAGKHTLVEYPLCQTLEEFDTLLRVAQEKRVVLHHGLTVLTEGLQMKMKELSARLGRIFHGHYRYFGGSGWYLDPKLRGDLFMALHIHFLVQFEDVLGRTRRVTATLTTQDHPQPIHSGTVQQEFESGATAFQEFGSGFPAQPSYMGWYIGENGWLGFEGRHSVRLVLADGREEKYEIGKNDAVATDTEGFIAEILDRAPSCVPESLTRRAVQLCLASAESARTGRKVEVS